MMKFMPRYNIELQPNETNINYLQDSIPFLGRMKMRYSNRSFSMKDVFEIESRIRQLEAKSLNANEELYTLIRYEIEMLEQFIEYIRYEGFFHKYNQDDINDVKEQSSMLALALLDNPKNIIVLPRYRYMRLCSFHHETNPSFMIYEKEGSYYCYGCHAGDSAITYLMKMYDIDFITAMETLAKAFDIKLPSKKTKENLDLIHKIVESYTSTRYIELKKAAIERNKGNTTMELCPGDTFSRSHAKQLIREYSLSSTDNREDSF